MKSRPPRPPKNNHYRPVKRRPRAGWEAAFKKMHQEGENRSLIPEHLDLNLGDWEW